MELGLYTFGDLIPGPRSGAAVSARQRMHELLSLARDADAAGLDILGVGEHHSPQFVGSATATILAAMAVLTTRIRLTSATTLLSSADPVRTFEEFATADLIAEGRVELIFGRGAFTDHFPLFGLDLNDYDALFTEKLGLFAALNAESRITWRGRFRSPLRDAGVFPRPAQPQLPVWIGAGSRVTVTRAAVLGYPLVLPMIGGTIAGYAELAALYRRAWVESGQPVEECRIAVSSHLHVAESWQEVREDFLPHYATYLGFLLHRPIAQAQLEQLVSASGPLVAGTVREVIAKLLTIREAIGSVRFLGQMDIGGQPYAGVARSLELYATQVAPVLRGPRPSLDRGP